MKAANLFQSKGLEPGTGFTDTGLEDEPTFALLESFGAIFAPSCTFEPFVRLLTLFVPEFDLTCLTASEYVILCSVFTFTIQKFIFWHAPPENFKIWY